MSESSVDDDPVTAPRMSPLSVYLLFLKFGMRAFGGPVVQIADQKEELVTKGKWISEKRITRVFALYQLLPGPEATELACYFGRLAGGRLGGVAGGLGFITPGLLLMLLSSWFYSAYGIQNMVFLSVLWGLEPAMAALVFRATHKIADFSFRNHAKEGKPWDWGLAGVGALAALFTVLNVNYFIVKIQLVIVYLCLARVEEAPAPAPAPAIAAAAPEGGAAAPAPLVAPRKAPEAAPRSAPWHAAAAFFAFAPLLVYIGITGAYGRIDNLIPMGVGVASRLGNTYGGQFVVGLVAGLVTFGGAYTAIPFVEYETVRSGAGAAWVSAQQFLDSLAICSVLPTPLVMFITMIGWLSGVNSDKSQSQLTGLWGALLMTLGMFIPAFVFPVCFHDSLERVVDKKGWFPRALDAIAATVVGQIAVTACQLLRNSVTANCYFSGALQGAVCSPSKAPLQACIFAGALNVAYWLPHKFTPVLIVSCSALAGVILFY